MDNQQFLSNFNNCNFNQPHQNQNLVSSQSQQLPQTTQIQKSFQDQSQYQQPFQFGNNQMPLQTPYQNLNEYPCIEGARRVDVMAVGNSHFANDINFQYMRHGNNAQDGLLYNEAYLNKPCINMAMQQQQSSQMPQMENSFSFGNFPQHYNIIASQDSFNNIQTTNENHQVYPVQDNNSLSFGMHMESSLSNHYLNDNLQAPIIMQQDNNQTYMQTQIQSQYCNQKQFQSPRRTHQPDHTDSLQKTPLSKKSTPHYEPNQRLIKQDNTSQNLQVKLDFANIQLQRSNNKSHKENMINGDQQFVEQQHGQYYSYPERRRTIASYNNTPESQKNYPSPSQQNALQVQQQQQQQQQQQIMQVQENMFQ